MLTLILAEAELELVPEGSGRHPSVSASARHAGKRPSRQLLDSSVHHELLKHLPEGERRGRPDLTHFFLLLALDSVLNQNRKLTVLVHTRNDELIRVAPETRIMRNYPRFVGLVEQLFRTKATPRDNPLLTLEEGRTLESVLKEHARGSVVFLRESGRRVPPSALARERAGADCTIVVGGFPHGDFRADVAKLASDSVSFGAGTLSVWTVATEILAHWEDALRLFDEEAPSEGGTLGEDPTTSAQ